MLNKIQSLASKRQVSRQLQCNKVRSLLEATTEFHEAEECNFFLDLMKTRPKHSISLYG